MSAKAKKQGVKSIYVVCGKDKFLAANACEELVGELLEPSARAMGLYQPDARKAGIAEVLDELRTLPFLAERRVVVLKDAGDFISEHRGALEKYFDEPSPTGVLILTVESWMKSTRLAKKLSKVGELINAGPLRGRQVVSYVCDFARSECGKDLAWGVAELLIELAGDEPGRLCREVEKLAMYVGKRGAIVAKDVQSLIGHNRMFGAFEVIDAMTAGDKGGAVMRLRKMFAGDRSAEFKVVGAFAFHFRRMFRAKALFAEGLSANQVSSQLRLWGNKDAFLRQVQRMSLERIGGVLAELARIDHAIKTGAVVCGAAMEQLIIRGS